MPSIYNMKLNGRITNISEKEIVATALGKNDGDTAKR